MPAPDGPRERRGPFRIVGQALRRAVSEQELDHLELPEFGGPGERRRTEMLVARRQVGASVEQLLRRRTSPLRAASRRCCADHLPAGWMFWFARKKFVGSYRCLSEASRG